MEFIESCLDNDFTVTLILYLNLLTNFEAKYGVYLETQELLGTQFLVIMAYFAVILINIVSKFKKLIQNSYDFLINCRIDSNLVQVYNASEQQQQQHKRLIQNGNYCRRFRALQLDKKVQKRGHCTVYAYAATPVKPVVRPKKGGLRRP